MTFAAIASGCDERQLLNESAKVSIEKQAHAQTATSVIALRSGFRVGETAVVNVNGALSALGTATPDKVLVLRCAGAEYAAVSELLLALKERNVVVAVADAEAALCGEDLTRK